MTHLAAILPDEAATHALGAALAKSIEPGLTVFLHGELGAGKTTLVRAVLRGLGYEGRVKSPTYALVELYDVSRLHLYHFDFYRFRDPREWIAAGFAENFGGRNVCLVEWPEKAAGSLPPQDLDVFLDFQDAGRVVRLDSCTPQGERVLASLRSHFPVDR
jgi:tRNA threonylcarbamoyladenosine biosynthesis protein TsaE